MKNRMNKEHMIFLKELAQNNDRNWFADHKPRYVEAHDSFKQMVKEIEDGLNDFDGIEKSKVMRIYRDVRFSKDKSPYKTFFAASFTRDGKYRRGGFYFKIEPNGKTMVGGGFFGPVPKDLKFIRDGILAEADRYKKLLASDDIKNYFGGLKGEALKTAPKGYDKNHPDIPLIRNKQFLLWKEFDDKTVLKADFPALVVDSFKKMLPFFQFMTDVLVFDENGVERE